MFQPNIVENAKKIVDSLIETDFFNEQELENTDYALEYLCEKINEKYINNNLSFEDLIITEEEFTLYLKEIIAGTILESLIEKGLIGAYDDEDSPDKYFFLTDEGKKFKEYVEENEKEEILNQNKENDK